MIEINSETFSKAFKSADENTKELMRDTRIHDCLFSLLDKSNANIEVGPSLSLIGYHILGIIDTDKTTKELSLLGISDPKLFLSKVITCIKNSTISQGKINLSPSDKTEDLTSDIAEAEAFINNLSSVRTMAKDMQESKAISETTHSSTQEAILSKKVSNPSQVNRWGSAEN
jgi:hypothetical protein